MRHPPRPFRRYSPFDLFRARFPQPRQSFPIRVRSLHLEQTRVAFLRSNPRYPSIVARVALLRVTNPAIQEEKVGRRSSRQDQFLRVIGGSRYTGQLCRSAVTNPRRGVVDNARGNIWQANCNDARDGKLRTSPWWDEEYRFGNESGITVKSGSAALENNFYISPVLISVSV